MNAAMDQAIFMPCSLAIMRKLAKHGINRVMVTMATKIWCVVRRGSGPVEASSR